MTKEWLRSLSKLLIVLIPISYFSTVLFAEDGAILTAPRTLHAGVLSSFTLTTLDLKTRLPVQRDVMVELASSDGSRKIAIFEETTGETGRLRGQFEVPLDWSGGHLIQANVLGLDETLEIATSIKKTVGILIETDKPIYKPGQTVLGRVLLLNGELDPVSGEVEVTFHDAKGLRIARQNLTTSDFGVAPFSLDLASEVNFGTWKIRAASGHGESVRDIRVEEYVLPRFELTIGFPKQWALVDETVLERAAVMLVSRQLANGSFETDDFLIHKEMDGGVENLYGMAAYTVNALAEYGSETVVNLLDKAAEYLTRNSSMVWDDPYSLSIASVALFRGEYDSDAEVILDRLLDLAVIDEDGMHWEPYPVETTGYVATALLMAWDGQGRPEAQQALEWLSSQRNSLGGYGYSTQDTVVALRALFIAARRVQRGLDVQLTVWQGTQLIAEFSANEESFDLLQQAELPTKQGALELRSLGSGSVGYQWVQRYHVPGQMLPPSKDLMLDVDYQTAHVQVDDVVDVRVTLEYTGLKERTGMVILDVGVPTGFEPVDDSLKALVSQQLVQRTEVACQGQREIRPEGRKKSRPD